jgi:hypothetical protein
MAWIYDVALLENRCLVLNRLSTVRLPPRLWRWALQISLRLSCPLGRHLV